MACELFAPSGYWTLTEAARDELCNGCGPDGILSILVPDTLYGLRITPACNIHDYMYALGKTIEDKDSADRAFLNNMVRIVDAGTRWRWLKRLRIRRAKIYYRAVAELGGAYFWAGKNSLNEMGKA